MKLVRSFGTAVRLCQKAIPSTVEMKSSTPWISEGKTTSNETVTDKVIRLAKEIEGQTTPPLSIDKNLTRTFTKGSTYNPFTLSHRQLAVEQKTRRTKPKQIDAFAKAGIDPRDLYTMPEILSRFVSSTGQILPQSVTGCNSQNQKKLGIAVKRARAAGILSSVHRDAKFLPLRNT